MGCLPLGLHVTWLPLVVSGAISEYLDQSKAKFGCKTSGRLRQPLGCGIQDLRQRKHG